MLHSLLLSTDQLTSLRTHLLGSDEEQAAFVFARVERSDRGVAFTGAEVYLCKAEDYDDRSVGHVELTDEAESRIIKVAWDARCALVEAHSHPLPGSRASTGALHEGTRFSPYDIRGLTEFVPHIQWRLKGLPYAALVFGPTDFDALVWPSRAIGPEPLHELRAGSRVERPTGCTLASPYLLELLGLVNKRAG